METDRSRLLDALPGMVWTARPDGVCDFVNQRWREYTGLTLEQAMTAWASIFHPDDLEIVTAAWARTQGGVIPDEINVCARMRRSDGVYRRFNVQTRPLKDEAGHLIGWCGANTDIEDRTRAEAQLASEKSLLERIVSGAPLPQLLEELCLQVESLSPGSWCSILFVEEDGTRFRVGAGPNLPRAYNAALEGLKIDAGYGPCSLAVVSRSTVIAADPPSDRRWAASPWPQLVTGFGLASCWSAPIFDSRGEVLGIFAVYKPEPQGPSEADEALIERFSHVAGIAMERARTDAALTANAAQLQRTHDHLAQAQALSHTGSFTTDFETDAHEWSDELYRILEFEPGTAVSFRTFRDLIHPDDQALFGKGFQAAVRDGAAFDEVFRLVTPKGAAKYLHAVAKRIERDGVVTFMGSIQDVTEAKLAEEGLKASEAAVRRAHDQLAQAQRLSRTGSFTSDWERDEHVWSEELYRILDVEPGSRISFADFHDRIHPDDRADFMAGFQQVLDEGVEFAQVFRWTTPNGRLKYLHAASRRLEGLFSIGAIQDVTENKLAEAALRESEARLRTANRYLAAGQVLSRVGSFTWDVGSDEMHWSDENYRIWEADPTQTPRLSMILDVIHPEDLELVTGTIAAARRTGEDFDVHYRTNTRDGAVKYVHTVGARIAEIQDGVVYVGTNQDVTESKRAEAELARANAYLTAAQRLSQTGSFTWDVQADEHNWSEVNYRIFGFEPGSKVTLDMMMKAIHPDDLPAVEALLSGAQIGQNFELVFRVMHTDGGVRHAHVMGQRIDQIADRPVFMGALQDITARKLAEDDLNRAREELAHVARITALSTLTASIAHEVSQPLAGIITNASTCLRMLAAEPPDLEGAAATAQRNLRDGKRAAEVIKRLRALYARRPPHFEPVSLQEIAREVLALLASDLQRRRVIVRTDFEPDLPTVAGDRVQLQQVILNLVLNAADALEDVPVGRRDLLIRGQGRPGGAASLEVRDSGLGFDPLTIDELFTAFHTTKPGGMGIGLSISRWIVEAHGGSLTAALNGETPGATFTFCIPAVPRAQSQQQGGA